MIYDVFNGDADGIIALIQLRLNDPVESKLITGVKRDNNLLKHVDVSLATQVNALDISMEKNTQALEQILANNIPVFYCDHHRTGEVPNSSNLELLVDTAPEVCTSLLINKKLQNKYIHWAIAAAYGDNLISVADELATANGLKNSQKLFLKELGTLINYNGYGASLDDLHFEPAELYKKLSKIENPFDLESDENSVFYKLKAGYEADLANVTDVKSHFSNQACEIYILPCEPWARRISGTFGNQLANANPNKAHAVLTLNSDGTYLVSVRAPLSNRTGADEICTQFATGGGRKAAAGINKLAQSLLPEFIEVINSYYS